MCNFNMLYIGCQYQVIKKVKKKRKADLPYLSFLQDEIGNTHIFFWPYLVRLRYSSYVIQQSALREISAGPDDKFILSLFGETEAAGG